MFQTSDFRGWGMLPDQVEEENPADPVKRALGSCSTWVKLGDRTIEAVRQACLGRQSRIQQSDPISPTTFIERIEVSDSAFLGAIDLALNPQFNALIGGRGTGKTSILEYVRHAMQDQPPSDLDDPKLHDEIAEKRGRIISDTLLANDATVTVHWINNRVPHVVQFRASAASPTLQIRDAEPVDVKPEELRSILPLQAFSQKQLSTVAVRTQELRRLITQPLQARLSAQAEQILEKRRRTEQLYDQVVELKDSSRALAGKTTELKSLQEQAKSTEESLPKLSDALQKALKENPLRLREKQVIETLRSDTTAVEDAITATVKGLSDMPHEVSLEDDSPQRGKVLEAHRMLKDLFSKVRVALENLQSDIRTDRRPILDKIDEWQADQRRHEELYREAEEEAKEHRDKLDLIKKLREQEAAVQTEIEGLRAKVATLPSLESDFRATWDEWVTLHKERGNILEGACAELFRKSGGELEVELKRGGDFREVLESLKEILRGCNIRDANWTDLQEHLDTDNPAQTWMNLMQDLRPLAELKDDDLSSDESVPELPSWNLTPGMRRRIVQKLSPPRRWVEVALTSLDDLPVFYYRPRDGERMEFRNASAGQQATALFKVLLAESSGPLMIDQPEEDLDNAIIQEITEVIWTAKTRRQLIFASHNANIVVNGDAELVIHCAYREDGDRTKGCIAATGAIDRPQIREGIKSVIEGGEAAFELRRQKYGF
ncbi:MAG: AAA family ATPase [Planctomycetota bacterium]